MEGLTEELGGATLGWKHHHRWSWFLHQERRTGFLHILHWMGALAFPLIHMFDYIHWLLQSFHIRCHLQVTQYVSVWLVRIRMINASRQIRMISASRHVRMINASRQIRMISISFFRYTVRMIKYLFLQIQSSNDQASSSPATDGTQKSPSGSVVTQALLAAYE